MNRYADRMVFKYRTRGATQAASANTTTKMPEANVLMSCQRAWGHANAEMISQVPSTTLSARGERPVASDAVILRSLVRRMNSPASASCLTRTAGSLLSPTGRACPNQQRRTTG